VIKWFGIYSSPLVVTEGSTHPLSLMRVLCAEEMEAVVKHYMELFRRKIWSQVCNYIY